MPHVTPTQYDFLSGIGVDVHAFLPEKQDQNHTIPLCGIAVPCPFKIDAHSDGDVALHALVDAILGAIGEGDIGEHFPPSDPRWKNKNSAHFVSHALMLCHQKNGALIHVDMTFLCEIPKISAYKKSMRDYLSHLFNIPIERINIKATTTEKLGFLGRKEGIAVIVITNVKMPT